MPRKWGFMVTGDKCEGLAETSGFYEQCLRLDWLLKHSSANPGTAYPAQIGKGLVGRQGENESIKHILHGVRGICNLQ